jgi:hypothetical protein
LDQSHRAVPGVQVTAVNTLTGLQRSARTGVSGGFSLPGLPVAGSYTLTARKRGFSEVRSRNLTLIGGATAEVRLRLNVEPGKTQITVTGVAGEVRSHQPELGIQLSATQMENTPLLNRRITYLPLLSAANRPAINQGDIFMNEDLFTTNGTGRRQTWFEVDGSNATDSWERQTIFTNIPLDSVQEMTVLTSAFSTEYGFTAGSVVNIVTKSGGNQFHGDVLGLWRPSATEAKLSGFTTATAASGTDITNDTLEQTSLALSGPIGTNGHTQFFVNGEYSWEDRASPVTSPIAPGNFIGQYRGWLGFLRIDHQINENNNLFFRSDADSFYDTNPNGIVGGNTLPRKEFGGLIYLGEFVYNPCTESLPVCESPAYLDNLGNIQSYTQSYENSNYTVNDTLWNLFARDDYRLRPNLSANLGLGYERQTFTNSTKDFAPRGGFAYNLHGNGKTVIRSGFGIYYSQIVDNSEANYALGGPTGVFNYTAAPGQIGFPTSISAVPLPAFPAGAVAPVRSLYIRPGESAYLNQFFPTSTLIGYPAQLLNPYTEQWTFGVERAIKPDWVLSVDYLGSHTVKINRPLDVDPPSPFIRTAPDEVRSAQAANCTRPYWIWWYSQHAMTCNPVTPTTPQPPYGLIQSDVNDGFAFYNALDVNFSHHFSRGASMLASYTWSHAIDNVDPDVPSQNPNDPYFTGAAEIGNAIFDQRNRFVLSGVYTAPGEIRLGGVATLASGVPYNVVTGITNSGDIGGTTDRPVVNGVVIGRNTGLGRPIYEVDPFVERSFSLRRENLQLNLRAEAFNAFNHANFVGYSGTWGDGPTPGLGFGQPLPGITNQLPAREIQFSAHLTF